MSDVPSLRIPCDVNISTNFDNADRPVTVCSSDRSGSYDVPVRDITMTLDHPLATDLSQLVAAPRFELLGASSLSSYFNGYFSGR